MCLCQIDDVDVVTKTCAVLCRIVVAENAETLTLADSSLGYERNQIGSKLFFRLIIIERLSPIADIHNQIVSDINQLQKKYPFVNLSHYGFKKNWEEILKVSGNKPIVKLPISYT